MKDFWGNTIADTEAEIIKGNPLIRIYGPGAKGVTCKSCVHLWRKRLSKVYLKCDLREDTNGPGTDHKAGWQSCGKYELGVSE